MSLKILVFGFFGGSTDLFETFGIPWISWEISLRSMVGLVIQATGRTDFEDGWRTGTKLEVRSNLQSVRSIPEVNMVSLGWP